MALMTLAEALASGAQSRNPLSLALAQETITIDQFSNILPIRAVTGTRNVYRREERRPNVAALNVGGTTTKSSGLGKKYEDEVGRFISEPTLDMKVATANDLVNAFTEQMGLMAWELAEQRSDMIVNGDPTPTQDGTFKGLKVLSDGLPASQKVTPSTASPGVEISTTYLDLLKNKIRYSVAGFLMHPNMLIDLKENMLDSGGVTPEMIQRQFAVFMGGNLVIQNRPVPSYDNIPIFTSEFVEKETTYTQGNKYRVYAFSFMEGAGLELFYPAGTNLGVQIEAPQMIEDKDEKFIRVRQLIGLTLRSTLSLAYLSNLKITNTA